MSDKLVEVTNMNQQLHNTNSELNGKLDEYRYTLRNYELQLEEASQELSNVCVFFLLVRDWCGRKCTRTKSKLKRFIVWWIRFKWLAFSRINVVRVMPSNLIISFDVWRRSDFFIFDLLAYYFRNFILLDLNSIKKSVNWTMQWMIPTRCLRSLKNTRRRLSLTRDRCVVSRMYSHHCQLLRYLLSRAPLPTSR